MSSTGYIFFHLRRLYGMEFDAASHGKIFSEGEQEMAIEILRNIRSRAAKKKSDARRTDEAYRSAR